MAKSYKLKDNNYIDTQSIVQNKQTLDKKIEGKIIESYDFNDIINTGITFVDINFRNRPSGMEYGVAITIHSELGEWQFVQQIFINNNDIANNYRFAIRSSTIFKGTKNWSS